MPSLKAKDRVSLCLFTFSDGRRCRTPRIASHPHFCLYHAQQEAHSLATQKLSNELAYFFSGSYLAACDLSTALSRILPAVIRGDVKPKTARTVAYLAQTLLQSIRVSQHEFINAYSSDTWRGAVRDSVKSDRDYLFPPKPAPAPKPAPPSAPQPNATVSSPPTPPISTVAPAPAPPTATPASTPIPPHSPRTPSAPTINKPRPQTTPKPAPATSQAQPIPAPQPAPPAASVPPANSPPQTTPQSPQQYFDRERGGLHFDHNYRLFIDGKPWDGKPL
jgi:hypothetical protein